VAGAAGGGLLGAAAGDGGAEAIAAGVLLGGLLGGALGDALDQSDRRYAATSFDRGLEYRPSGRPSTWHNPDSGHSGSLTPVRTYRDEYGYCREFVQTVTVEGRTEQAHGIACRQPDGTWRVDQ
jgi:surface antigen